MAVGLTLIIVYAVDIMTEWKLLRDKPFLAQLPMLFGYTLMLGWAYAFAHVAIYTFDGSLILLGLAGYLTFLSLRFWYRWWMRLI